MTEDFSIAALPRSLDPGDRFHVSLFVTPRLTPADAAGRLRDFPHFNAWTKAVAGADIGLIAGASADGSGGQAVSVRPLHNRLRPALWRKVFPPSTPVRGRPQPQVPQDLVSYPAHRIDADALNLHAIALLQEPVRLPSALGPGFREMVERQLVTARGVEGADELTLEFLLEREQRMQGRFTGLLDKLAADSGLGVTNLAALTDTQPIAMFDGEYGLDQQLLDVHLARSYYERLAPPAEASFPSPDPPDPDFHERCALLAGTPPLLRRLGLVIDLRVDDLEALREASWIRGRIEVDGLALDPTPVRAPRTACGSRGAAFFARAEGDDWADGWLRLAHPDGRFTLLDLDPDASAMKVERHWRNLVRLAAAENDGQPVSAAPQALRAAGFSIARTGRAEVLRGRVERAAEKAAAREQGIDEPLSLEEVARGLRLEVWDDGSEAWHSLHARRIDIEVRGEEVERNVRDVGYLKGAALTRNPADEDAPPQLHEVLAGWEGWSLSAPPPGKTILRDDTVGEVTKETSAAHGVIVRSRVQRGSLPRLRYGRSYSFRAVAVDLAGNSPPHEATGAAGALRELRGRLGPVLDERARRSEPTAFARELLGFFRERRALPATAPAAVVGGVDLEGGEITGEPGVDRLLSARAARRGERLHALAPTRLERVERAFVGALHDAEDLHAATADVLDAGRATALLEGLDPGAVEELLEESADLLLDLVTEPRPFLRWHPVLPPTVVPRHPYSAGESLLTLVIRSGVELTDGEPTIMPADQYAASHPALGYRPVSERHLAPPKTSQREAELHGMFDEALGAGTAAARRKALATALREAGTLNDTEIPDLAVPGKTIPQQGVKVVSPAGAAADLATLGRGEPLPRGQYVIHDVDELVLPYLPDPMAVGLSMVFPDAGATHRLEFPWSVEGLRLEYRRGWPAPQPYRIVLESGERVEGRVDGRLIRLALPPGEQLRLRLSSALRPEQLDLLGLWRTRPESYRQRDEIAEAAADGWLWWLTPFDEVRLVHAVPRPVEAPRAVGLEAMRADDDTGTGLRGVIDLHGPSTGRIDLEARWSEPIDDLTAAKSTDVEGRATPWGADVAPDEDFLVLLPWDLGGEVALPDGATVRVHQVRHEFGDTKHRLVDYSVRGSTRYREHFDPAATIDELSVVGPVARVSVPSSARPPKPVVHDVIPLFRWDESTEPEQPFGLRRTRRSGLRVYLERPWYATGEGELLGLVLGPAGGGGEGVPVSIWAGDPVWRQRGPAYRESLPLRDVLEMFEPEARDQPGRPVRAPESHRVVDLVGEPEVAVLGYRPEYNADRRLWFVDVAFDQSTAFWPFVRLVLARFQPESLDGKHLSPLVGCDFAQLAPDRTATLSRPDQRHVRIVVSGPVGHPREIPDPQLTDRREDVTPVEERVTQSRTLRARLEQRDGDLRGSDLGWVTVAQTELALRGFDNWFASWLGTLELPRALSPRRPGTRANWRVTVEEWERLRADPAPGEPEDSFRSEARLIYADHLYL